MLVDFFTELWQILTALSVWLFFGAIIAGLLKLWLPENFIFTHMGKPSFGSIVKTTLLGIPMPLCSCGVLPTTIALKKGGANNGAAVSFLISTPQTGVDSIMVTASFLGWPLALFKVLAALVTGLIGGLAVQLSERNHQAHAPTSSATNQNKQANCHDDLCLGTTLKQSNWQSFYNYSVEELIGGIYVYLVIGVVIAALVSVLFPDQLLANYPVLNGPLGMLAMLAIATPIYICTTGSVPIAASLIAAGLPVGSALVFLMAGPATNAATLGAVYKSFGKKFTAIYLTVVVIGSITFGLLFQNWLGAEQVLTNFQHEHHSTWRHWLDSLAAVALLGLIIYWSIKDGVGLWKRLTLAAQPLSHLGTIKISGMTCNNCVTHVRRALETIEEIKKIDINLETGVVTLFGKQPIVDFNRIQSALTKAGYQSETIQ